MLAEERRGRALFEQSALPGQTVEPWPELNLDRMRRIAATHDATLIVYSIVYDSETHLLPSRFGGLQAGAERELLIWVIQPNGAIERRRQALASDRGSSQASLSSLVGTLRSALSGRNRGGQQDEPDVSLRRLYQILIAPIADLLPAKSGHLVFVPQGPLLAVPFAALQDGSGRYLIERHPIVTVPALKVLALTRRVADLQSIDDARGASLVVGNPQIGQRIASTYEVGPLPNAEQEAKSIAAMLNVQPLLAEAATKAAVIEQLPRARLVHFATHGLLRSGSVGGPLGAIVLTPRRTDNGLLSASEVMGLKLRARLAVLSACDTGRGRLTGEGVVGLSYAFIRAGVPSVLVSLWSVPDKSTGVLMSHFYRIRPGQESLAEALRQAMLATIADGHRDPRQWAAFTLIGQWRTP